VSLAAVLILIVSLGSAFGQVPKPADIIGFEPGTDYKLMKYDQVYRYFQALDEASERIVVEEIGKTTLGKPMILAFISSKENLDKRQQYKAINKRLALAKGLTDQEAEKLAQEGVATVWIDGGLHATELAGSHFTPGLAYWLVTDESREAKRIRDNVLLLLNPNMNPDGLDIVSNWYEKNVGTAFETSPVPELYHHYVGHDNNRDWYMFTQLESKAAANIFYPEWFPQIMYNHHQTGPFPGRIWVPPALDPLNPHVDPLVIASYKHIGQYQLKRFMKEGKPGVSTDINYRVAWTAGFMHAAPQFHNILGLFTETALYGFATPHCYTDEELGDTFSRGVRLDTRLPSMMYPVPWKGGCWHLSDAMEYMTIASKAVLDAAAKLKEDYLYNIYYMGKRQIARGEAAEGGPFAYVIDPSAQHDPGSAIEMLRTFRQGGVEIRRADGPFRTGGKEYAAGTYVIPPQAFRPFVVDLMERKEHPDRFDYPGGPPERPYDFTGYNLVDQLGVEVHRVTEAFDMPGPEVETIPPLDGGVQGSGSYGYLLSHAWNHNALASNRLLKDGARLAWTQSSVQAAGREWPAGTILVRDAKANSLSRVAKELGLTFYGLDAEISVPLMEIRAPKIGIYKTYVSNMEEGWTRWVLDQYEFDLEVLHDPDIRAGDLSRFDIIVLPDQEANGILNGHAPMTMPERYTGGVGAEGAAALKRFVENGGWVMAFHHAVEFAAEMFGLPIRNAVAGVDPKQYFIPGTLIRFETEPSDYLAFGMAKEGSATFWRHGLVMDIIPAASEKQSSAGELKIERDIVVYARFPKEDIRLDGWAIGDKKFLAEKPAALRAPLGSGHVVLIGFTPDTRGQSRNAFKLIFNPLYASTVKDSSRPTTTQN
jgi:hypothetical protein